MNCVILAAGYATRLYPLTEKTPKPLLPVLGKPILSHLLEDLSGCEKIERFIVVSNYKFVSCFEKWAEESPWREKITVIDDGTENNDERLGAVTDIKFAVDTLGLKGDLMVIAGDNVLDFSLCSLVDYFEKKSASCIMRYFEPDTAKCRKSGVISFDCDDCVTSMEEKPENPKTNWLAPPFYVYTAADVALLGDALNGGCSKDAPGSFAAWLSQRRRVCAMEMKGKRYDIGTVESYEMVQKTYKGIENNS